ncbi:MAG: hypothetical protein ACMV17_14145 [Macellibacteroides fermentans]|uniref:hypothetical protein n=1 Tax=Macellibacteroides fermentans TaxID=879969 RepID=UPI003B7588BC
MAPFPLQKLRRYYGTVRPCLRSSVRWFLQGFCLNFSLNIPAQVPAFREKASVQVMLSLHRMPPGP